VGEGEVPADRKLAGVLIYYALQLLQADWLSSGAAAAAAAAAAGVIRVSSQSSTGSCRSCEEICITISEIQTLKSAGTAAAHIHQ
jgi:hypothetical protein